MFGNKEENDISKLRKEIEQLKEQMRALSEGQKTSDIPVDQEETQVQEEEQHSHDDFHEPLEQPEEAETVEAKPRRRVYYYGPRRDFGDRLGDYIEGFVEDVMEGVGVELERSLFSDRHVGHSRRRSRREPIDAKEASVAMSALGNEHRIRILEELSFGGAYSAGLQEALPEISASTLSSHLDVLEEAGLITQERRRGRYLITMPGRLAVKMAYQISDRIQR